MVVITSTGMINWAIVRRIKDWEGNAFSSCAYRLWH